MTGFVVVIVFLVAICLFLLLPLWQKGLTRPSVTPSACSLRFLTSIRLDEAKEGTQVQPREGPETIDAITKVASLVRRLRGRIITSRTDRFEPRFGRISFGSIPSPSSQRLAKKTFYLNPNGTIRPID